MTPSEPWPLFTGGTRLIRGALVTSALAAATWIACAVADTKRALAAWLVADLWLASTLLGALALLMTFHAARATWPLVLRRVLEAITGSLPVVVLTTIPILLTISRLYPWATPSPPGHRLTELHRHLGVWFHPAFFTARSVFYLGSWLVTAELLRRWSRRQDLDGHPKWTVRAERLSAGGLVLFAFTLTFAAMDWVMSLTPEWSSSAFGIYVFAGGFVAAMAVVVLTSGSVPAGGPHLLSLGKLLLAHVVFWAYIAYSQFFIHWIADIPAEVTWWLPRVGAWGSFSIALVGAQFAVPFTLLLLRSPKRNRTWVSAVSLWLLVAHYIDAYWLVMPSLAPLGPSPHLADAAALVTSASAALALGVWRARGASLAAFRAPGFAASLRYEGT